MLEILQFIFQDFWHFIGTLMLLGVICGGVGSMFNRNTIINNEKKEG